MTGTNPEHDPTTEVAPRPEPDAGDPEATRANPEPAEGDSPSTVRADGDGIVLPRDQGPLLRRLRDGK